MKKVKGDKQIGVTLHTCPWKYHKETPCVATFISNKLKCCFSFYLFSFSSTKSKNRKAKQLLLMRKGWHHWEAGDVRERG
jgi:hypothetical protein